MPATLQRTVSGEATLGLLAFLAAAGSPAPVLAGREASSVIHTVEAGQTLWSIAHYYGVRVEDLLRINHIDDPTVIFSGQELTVPSPRTRRRGDPAPGDDEHSPALSWPLSGKLTSLYGRRGRALHAGLDIAATPGTIIVAAAKGTVVRAGTPWGRYGNVVLLEHRDGFATLYAHASTCFVHEGDVVRKGQAIAAVGRTGNATGPHLHFEVWSTDRTVDPLRYLEIQEDLKTALFSR